MKLTWSFPNILQNASRVLVAEVVGIAVLLLARLAPAPRLNTKSPFLNNNLDHDDGYDLPLPRRSWPERTRNQLYSTTPFDAGVRCKRQGKDHYIMKHLRNLLLVVTVIITIYLIFEHTESAIEDAFTQATKRIDSRFRLTKGGVQRHIKWRQNALCNEKHEPKWWKIWRKASHLRTCVEYDLSLRLRPLGDKGVRSLTSDLSAKDIYFPKDTPGRPDCYRRPPSSSGCSELEEEDWTLHIPTANLLQTSTRP